MISSPTMESIGPRFRWRRVIGSPTLSFLGGEVANSATGTADKITADMITTRRKSFVLRCIGCEPLPLLKLDEGDKLLLAIAFDKTKSFGT